jgi:hypothetical protein
MYTNLSEIVDTIIYVPLECNEQCIIGTVNQIISTGDGYLILDSYNSKSIYLFDLGGKFVRKYGTPGRGPGEYLAPGYISYDYSKDVVSVYDEEQRKIIQYHLDGNLYEETKINLYCPFFASLNDEKYVFFADYHTNKKYNSKDSLYNVFISDSEYKVIQKGLPFSDKTRPNIPMGSSFGFSSFNNDSVFLTIPYDNTVYNITNNSIWSNYKLDFGKSNIPDSFFNEFLENPDENAQAANNFLKENGYQYITYGIDTRDYLFLYTHLKSMLIYFSKKDKETYVYKYPPINDVDYLSYSTNMGTNGYDFIGITYPYIIQKAMTKVNESKSSVSSLSKNVESFVDSIEENDNPIIVLTKLK